MARKTEVLSRTIFHGLPSLEQHDGKGYSAIVTGSNGISGANLVKVLAESPQRWKTIYALSRRPPKEKFPANVIHIACDFLEPAELIARKLRSLNVQVYGEASSYGSRPELRQSLRNYVFFMSYIQPPPLPNQGLWSDVEETERVNGRLRSF